MFKSDWLFGCCTTVTVTVKVKERRKMIPNEGGGVGIWIT